MRAIKEARKLIESNSSSADAITLSRLVLALESEIDFPITDIYLLDYDKFKLALEILQEWRLDRHFAGKSRLYDASMHLAGMTAAGDVPAAPKAAAKPAPKKKAASAKPSEAVKAAAKPAAKKAAAPKKAAEPAKAEAVTPAAEPAAPAAAAKDSSKS